MLSSPGLGTLCPQTVETSEQAISEPAEAAPQILSTQELSMQDIANRRRQRKENDRRARVNARHAPQAAPVEIITTEYPAHLYNSWIKCGHSEMQGRRPQMEDCLTVMMHFRTQPLHSLNGFNIGKQCLRDALQKETIEEVFVAIFDGHGGDKASKYAGAEMHKIFKRKIEQYELFKLQQKRLKKNPQDTLEDLGKPVKQSELLFHLHQYLRLPDGDHLHLFPPTVPTPNSTELTEKKEEEQTTTAATDDSDDEEDHDQEEDEDEEEDEEEMKMKAMTKLVVVPSAEPLNILALPESETIQLLMREAFIEVNESMSKNGVPHGTTASAVYLQPQNGKCYIANVGDSRILLHRGGKSYRLTVDHRPNDEDEEQRVKESGGRITNQRVNGMLAITRAIGDSFLEPFVTADPYTTCVQLCDEDEFLIVACDGVWDFLSDEEVCKTVQQEEDPRRASVQVRDLAYSKGSTDNISAVVMRFACKQACEPAASAEACQQQEQDLN